MIIGQVNYIATEVPSKRLWQYILSADIVCNIDRARTQNQPLTEMSSAGTKESIENRQRESTLGKHGNGHKAIRSPALQSNSIQQQSTAYNQNQDAILHKQSGHLHLHAKCEI
jgi:hypothetical protein